MSITINGTTNTITGASGLAIAANTAVTGTLSASGDFTSSSAVNAQLNGSDSVAVGANIGIRNTANNRAWLCQLSASNNADWWHYNGSAWTKYMTLSSTGLAVTGTLSTTGITSVTDATDATSTTAASLKTAGGLATVKQIIAGTAVSANFLTAIPAGGATTCGFKSTATANFGVFFGSGAPTLSAAKGSLYLRSDGAGVNDRMYVATDAVGTWTAVVTVG